MDKKEQAKEVIGMYRGILLDGLEIRIGETKEWPHVRAMVLKVFGDRGMEGKILEILDK